MTDTALAPRPQERAEIAIHCDGLVRIYKRHEVEVMALQGLDLTVEAGDLVAIVGASGSGKSTLLNILSGLDRPTAGSVTVAGHDLLSMSRRERRHYRRHTCGFVWQQATRNLLPFLTAVENLELPARLAGRPVAERRTRARDLLELLGIPDCADQRPTEMSSGQQQRLSIAVAVANDPQVLFCDEPTGELDTAAARDVFAALRSTNEQLGTTCVVVTHDQAVTGEVQRTVAIRNGRTATETLRDPGDHLAGEAALSEYAVLDRFGRLQIPEEFVQALHLHRRVRLQLEADHIGIWPPDTPPPHAEPVPGAATEPEDQ
ncbi:MAG: ABC transporter ATP-binding protein [Nocardioidaceae bacterium]